MDRRSEWPTRQWKPLKDEASALCPGGILLVPKGFLMSLVAKSLTQAEYQALLVGLPKYCPTAVFTISGQSYTSAQVVTLIQGLLNASVTAATARAALAAAREAVVKATAAEGQTVKGVREVVGLMFNNSPTILTELAIVPRKSPKPLSAEARAAASAKAKATRKARGTTSKKQKATVSGNVTGVDIIPVTAPATPSSAASSPAVTPTVTTTPAVVPTVAATGGTPRA